MGVFSSPAPLGGGGCYGIGGLCTISVVSTGGGINRWSTYLSMHILGVATEAIFISVLPLEMGVGGIGGPSAWAVIFLSSPNVVGGVPFLVEKVVLPLLLLSSR